MNEDTILVFEDDKDGDQLKSAIERAKERGIQYKRELRLAPREEQIEWIATEIFFNLYGGYMGQPYYCDLPEERGDPEQDGRNWRMSKRPYKDVAGFILKIFGPEDETEAWAAAKAEAAEASLLREEIAELIADNERLRQIANSETNETTNLIYEIDELKAELDYQQDEARQLRSEINDLYQARAGD